MKKVISEVTKLVIGLAMGILVTNIFANNNVILTVAGIVVGIAVVLWLLWRPEKPTFCESVGVLWLGFLPTLSCMQEINILDCVWVCAYLITGYVCGRYKRKCKR